MIDLHTHILPAVDDGVETDEEAIEFARVAAADGIRTIVATPHCREGSYENPRTRVLERVAALEEQLAEAGVEITVLPGAEVHICPDLVPRIRDGRAPTLADNGKTLLLELSLSQYPAGLENLVFELKLAGIEVVFAHPERIRYFQDDAKRYEEMVRLGAYGQITTGSILGLFGSKATAFSRELLSSGLVHVIASDAHNVRGRPPQLTAAVETAAAWVGELRATSMVDSIPQALLEGRTPDVPPVEPMAKRSRSFLSRWFGGD